MGCSCCPVLHCTCMCSTSRLQQLSSRPLCSLLLWSCLQAPQLPAAATAADLPHAVLLLILQHLPAQQRLGSAALVSTSWRAAAADATTSIHKDITHSLSQASLSALMARVCNHMQRSPSAVQSCTPSPITSLHLTGAMTADHDPSALLPLTEPLVAPSTPLPALRELRVSGLVLQLGPKAVTPQGSSSISNSNSSGASSGGGSGSSADVRVHPGWVQHAPNLTRLELDGCELGPGMHSLAALTALTNLRHLLLGVGEMDQQPPGRDFPPVMGGADASCGGSASQGALPDLMALQLSATKQATEPAREPARVEHTGHPQPEAVPYEAVTLHRLWAHLTGLTHLDLSGSYAFPGAEDHPWLPALSCLTQLRELRLCMV